MTPSAVILASAAYVLPLALLALLLAGRRKRPAWLLVSLIAALPVFYVVQYLLLQSLQGWPVDDALTKEFMVAFQGDNLYLSRLRIVHVDMRVPGRIRTDDFQLPGPVDFLRAAVISQRRQYDLGFHQDFRVVV